MDGATCSLLDVGLLDGAACSLVDVGLLDVRLSSVVEGRLMGDGTVVGNRVMETGPVVLMTVESVRATVEVSWIKDEVNAVEFCKTEVLGTGDSTDVGIAAVVLMTLGSGTWSETVSWVDDETGAVELSDTGAVLGNGAAGVGAKAVVFARLGSTTVDDGVGNGTAVVGAKAVVFARLGRRLPGNEVGRGTAVVGTLGGGTAEDGNSCVADEVTVVELSAEDDEIGDGTAVDVSCWVPVGRGVKGTGTNG